VAARLRAGLADLYRFYQAGAGVLTHIHRDFAALPDAYQQRLRDGDAYSRDVVAAPFGGTENEHRRRRAVIGHATSFWTWRSLCIEQGLSNTEAVDAMTGLGFVYVDCMSSKRLPPVAAVIGFIACINRGDIEGLGKLMTDDHELVVFGEEAVRGRVRNTKAWAGYAAAYPDYVIHPRSIVEPHDGCVVVLGHTTGSHLGLPDHEERALSVIWLAEVRDGRLCCWRLLEDTPDRRAELGLTPAA